MSVTVPNAIQDESDRQAVLLALAALAAERPGWEYMLGRIADKLRGRAMFEQFLALRRTGPPPAPADELAIIFRAQTGVDPRDGAEGSPR